MLTFGRKQRSALALHRAPGCVDDAVRDILAHFEAPLSAKGIAMAFAPGAGETVKFDRDVLEQILGNLLNNVEKYAIGADRVAISSTQDGDHVSITVADTGPGVPAERGGEGVPPVLPGVSDRLTDGVAGTGIGLAIARDLARLHGGDLTLERASAGACFHVTIHAPRPRYRGVGMKVLIAEDDVHIREGLVEVLAGEGYETIAAADGQAALDAYDAERPDFVCLDIMMPGMDGYEVCRAIRRKDTSIPVIFISAKSEEIDRVVGLELGADDFIMKPFGVREVIARIRAVTRRCMQARPKSNGSERFTLGDIEVSPAELRARRGTDVIDLSLRDVKILEALHRRKGEVVDRNTLFDECWGQDYMPSSRTLDQHVSQLRKRIEKDPKDPLIIQTVHGVGYRCDV